MSKFQELVGELEGEVNALAKALPADDGDGDEKIAAAAAEGGSQGGHVEPDGDEPKKEGEGDDAPMAKSFEVTLADGSKASALDATDLIKSMQTEIQGLGAKLAEQDTLAKSMESLVGLVKTQNTMIKSLSDRVQSLAGEGRGRKSIVTIQEKPAAGTELAKSEPTGVKPEEFMAKAMAAYDGGKLTGVQLTAIDVSLRNGAPIDPALIRTVIGA